MVHKIFSINKISTSIEGHNSFENAYTKFDQNPQINSQDIDHKQNSDIDQGP